MFGYIEGEKSFKDFIAAKTSLGDNKEELLRLSKTILLIIENELTELQRYCIKEYILEAKKMKEISKDVGIEISGVSKHIKLAKKRITKFLRYSKLADKYVNKD